MSTPKNLFTNKMGQSKQDFFESEDRRKAGNHDLGKRLKDAWDYIETMYRVMEFHDIDHMAPTAVQKRFDKE